MIQAKKLDRSVPIPLYYQLRTLLEREIDGPDYHVDSAIPTEDELIDLFHVSRTTVRQAIAELVREGKLYRVKSKGTFVAKPKTDLDFFVRLRSFDADVHAQGKQPSTEVLEFQETSPDAHIIEALHLRRRERVIFLKRRRFIDGIPSVVVETYLPADRCAYLLGHDFSTESLYEVIANNAPDDEIHHVQRTIEAFKADQDIASRLEIPEGDPVLFFTSIGHTATDEPIEFSRAFYRADTNRFRVTVLA